MGYALFKLLVGAALAAKGFAVKARIQ